MVDFAYHVHTDVGNNMTSAKVNGALVAPDYELNNAEVVEIIQNFDQVTTQDVLRHKVPPPPPPPTPSSMQQAGTASASAQRCPPGSHAG